MHPPPPRAAAPRGFTLPELLVGLAIGLAVLTTALTLWHSTRSLWLGFVAQQQLQHNARRAFDVIDQQAHLAGAATLLGVAGSTGLTPSAAYGDSDPEVRATDGAAAGDTLSLGHWRSVDPTDCQGNSGTSGTSAALVLSQFQRSTTTTHDFACKDARAIGSTFQALAEGAEDLQIQLAEVSADGLRVQWKTPSQVTQWSQVQAIEVCLRWVSRLPVAASDVGVIGCNGERIAGDGHVRQVMRRTIALRQRSGASP